LHGVTLYVGAPGTGKTHAALADLRNLKMPTAILDLGGSMLLQSVPLGASPPGSFATERRWTPETADELDALLIAFYKRGNVALLVDDSTAVPSRELSKLCRLWRPRNLRIMLTTQHISGDVSQAIQACDPLIYVYRTTSTRSLEWLKRWHGIEPEEVADLKLGEALEVAF
jgi:hypothetical protein